MSDCFERNMRTQNLFLDAGSEALVAAAFKSVTHLVPQEKQERLQSDLRSAFRPIANSMIDSAIGLGRSLMEAEMTADRRNA